MKVIPETGNDVTGSHSIFPRLFLTIVVVQNIPLRMTGSSMDTGWVGCAQWYILYYYYSKKKALGK